MQRGGMGGGGGGGGGGGSKGGGKGSSKRQLQPRDGDWECRRCAFYPNFANRARCYECGDARPTPAAANRGGTLTAGPVGASGLRPMLAWGGARLGATEGAPTHRVLGSSAAAPPKPANNVARTSSTSPTQLQPTVHKTGTSTAAAASSRQPGTSCGGAKVPAVAADADGFVEVVRRSAWRGRAKQGGAEADATHRDAAADLAKPVRWGDGARDAVARDEDEGDGWQMEWEEDVHGSAEQPVGEEEDSATLKQRLDKEQAAVRALEREGIGGDHPAMVAAVAARDATDAA
jgi:hypothetical protein